MRFRTTLRLEGRTATGFEVPAEVVEALGGGKRPAVRVTINGYTYRSTIAPYTEAYMLPLAAEHRDRVGVRAGDEIDVDLELDSDPREVEVPDDFAAALAAEPEAKAFFEGLSYSNQRWHTLSIEGAKTAETRERRIAKSVAMLKEGRAR
jgi:hypothetical protein